MGSPSKSRRQHELGQQICKLLVRITRSTRWRARVCEVLDRHRRREMQFMSAGQTTTTSANFNGFAESRCGRFGGDFRESPSRARDP